MGETFVQSARLSARMILLHPRYVDSSPCVFFDAKVVGDCSQEQPIWCSLRYRLIFPGQTIPYGVCDVVARVSVLSLCRRRLLEFIFIGRQF